MAEECNNEIHVDDLGTEFIVTIVECTGSVTPVPVDISSATVKEIIFEKQDKTKLTKVAVFTSILSGGTGDGSDGKISYFSIAGDLDIKGKYKLQGIVTTPSGKWYSTIESFKVHENL